jgi:hypothetical protein
MTQFSLPESHIQVVKSISMLAEVSLQAPINSIERMMLMENVQMFYDCLGEFFVCA